MIPPTGGVMRHFMLLLGIGLSALASDACADGPSLPLAIVAARNAADLVQPLLLAQPDPNQRDGSGLTPLMWAARTGAVDAMKTLLDGGADPTVRDVRNGWTPLFHAIHTRQVKAVRLLLDRGVDPNRPARMSTPLLMAASDPDPAIVQLLLAHGADPNKRGIGGLTGVAPGGVGGGLGGIGLPRFGGWPPAGVQALLSRQTSRTEPDTRAAR